MLLPFVIFVVWSRLMTPRDNGLICDELTDE